jgi:integrase
MSTELNPTVIPRRKRPSGSGSLFRYPGSSVYHMKWHVRGEPFRQSTGTRNRLEAQAILRTKLAEVATGTFIPPSVERTTVTELFEGLSRDYKINGRKSLEDTEARWRLHLEPVFGALRAVDVSTDRLNRYVEQRQTEGATVGTINRELSCLRRAFVIAAESEPPKLARVPKFPRFKEHNTRTGFVEEAQYTKLAQAAARHGLWMAALFELGYQLGWRDCEVKHLQVSQVDLASRTLRLDPDTTKNSEGRMAVMPARLYALISQCVLGKQPTDFVFTRQHGGPVRDFRVTWRQVCTEAGVGKLLFHDLRRTAVRNMVRNGIPERVAMMISGHKTRSVFDRYNIVSMGDLREAAARLDRRDQQRTTDPTLGRVWAESAPSPVQLPQPN